MERSLKFAVIGGDMRQARLAELLDADGNCVRSYALEGVGELRGTCRCLKLEDAVAEADCVVLPLPVCGREGYLNAPFSEDIYCIERILTALPRGAVICAGRIDARTASLAEELELDTVDYFAREELAVGLAVATAEGALQIAMQETPFTICGAKALVIGYGRIGKVLANRLHGLGADTYVSARNCADRTWIAAMGYNAENTLKLDGRLGEFDLVFNTVPARVLDEQRLAELKEGCLCMDLASKPGGMDFAAASRLGVKAVWALSLPGEVAPYSAGAMIRDTVYNILTERGELG